MTNPNLIDKLNKGTYTKDTVVEWYNRLDTILKPEEILLKKLLPFIKDKKILDIGFGGGRTTSFLLEVSKDYTGIDYSSQFVDVVKNKYKTIEVYCCDARNMKQFADSSFDFVLFSFNSIDYISHEDRIMALKEIYRVLKKGGFFMFSTHNRDHKNFNKLPWQEKEIKLTINYIKDCIKSLYYLPKHLKMKKHEIHNEGYAIINDNAHGFSLLTYYISISQQQKQLKEIGFENIEAYDMEGNEIKEDVNFPWTYYLTRKT